MNHHTFSKLISAVLLATLLAFAVHQDSLRRSRLGREEFLADQSARFDRQYAKPDSFAIDLFAGLFMAGALFGAYELLAFGISKALKATDHG